MAGTDPTDLYALAQEYLDACVIALDTISAPGLGGAPERRYVAPGVPALDCCPQLTVDVRAVQEDPRSPSGPGSGQRARYGARKNNVFMVATIVRCYPTDPIPPNVNEMELAAEQVNADGWALWNEVWNMIRSGELFTLCDDSSPELRQLTPSGGCAGWTLSMRVELEGYET
jgi:hypothetical protein